MRIKNRQRRISVLTTPPLELLLEAQSEDIAKGAVWLATDEVVYVTGMILVVDGGLTAGFFS